MKHCCLGILAHVDAGKTSMAEAMLYTSGKIRELGRVDHRDAYLDTYRLEKERGITIFSKQAVFDVGDLRVDLLDTPGHMDFSAEMERTLGVLDYALLVVSGPDGVQAHTETLWNLLKRYRVPTFLWINKMDICERSEADVLDELQRELSKDILPLGGTLYSAEDMASLDDVALAEYLESETVSDGTVASLIARRRLFPCCFGSALKLENVDGFLRLLEKYTIQKDYPPDFGARVFKISREGQGDRLSWLRVTGGSLHPRDVVGEDKITQIRVYSGAKYAQLEEAEAGQVVAVCGLDHSYIGQGLGTEKDAPAPVLEPVMTYAVTLPDGIDVREGLAKLSQLGEEDPMLRIVWNDKLREIQVQLMGEVQTEVLREIIRDRFGFDVTIGTGRIMYKETIAQPVIGMGHFEPLRHYAEVHLLMEPLAPGTGIVLEAMCAPDTLDINWQRLILTNLAEKEHVGVLTGSPITDMKISVIAGRAHLKHTEGGDFRQATYRAVRQGLMRAKNVLLEPYYDFYLVVPSEHIGRAITDLKSFSADFGAPKDLGGSFALSGRAPVSELGGYQPRLLSYTKGRGRISCHYAGYYPCHETAKVVDAIGYEASRDVENTSDSVFCSHGAGVNVPWNMAPQFMHIDSGIKLEGDSALAVAQPKVRSGNIDFDERELEEIMLREFGPIKRPQYTSVTYDYDAGRHGKTEVKKEYIIVDGYNIIYDWEELKDAAKDSFAAARKMLADRLANFRGYRGCELVLVFDGYKVKDNLGTKEDHHGIRLVYTKEGESADHYIEGLIHEIGKNYSVKVATGDGLIQLMALRMGVMRMSSQELRGEVLKAEREIAEIIAEKGEYRPKLGDVL